jgi:predicted component of viral defense system (DUF524 family)
VPYVQELRIPVILNNGDPIEVILYADVENSLINIGRYSAEEYNESPYQLKEGCFYEYQLPDHYRLKEIKDLARSFRSNPSNGSITPGTYTGGITLNILGPDENHCGSIELEVCSVKTGYHDDYRKMLDDIAEYSTELLLQHSSPASHKFIPDHTVDPKTLYQRFAFLRSIILSEEFRDSVHKIISNPVTTWIGEDIPVDIRNAKRFDGSALRQIASARQRIPLPAGHPVRISNPLLESVPGKMLFSRKKESVDTHENRFIKYVLQTFASDIGDIRERFNKEDRSYREASQLISVLEDSLSHSLFSEISPIRTLTQNSQVLQRKEGYREIYRAWLNYDLAAKLAWKGGDDIYSAGKRDVAALYEYWLFFKLTALITEIFKLPVLTLSDLIKDSDNGLELQLKSGREFSMCGHYEQGGRKLCVKFSYNKTFSRSKAPEPAYPAGGSWTMQMRPDYSLSLWPADFTEKEAEEQESIIHIHFDAKYRIDKFYKLLGRDEDREETDDEIDAVKRKERDGEFKRADMLKMHAYKDAIRRSAGAYILYPGDKTEKMRGFREIVPGLGAFPVSPSSGETGMSEVRKFIEEVLRHYVNRTSDREKMSYQTYSIHGSKNAGFMHEPVPEKYNNNRTAPPSEIHVLVGYYHDNQEEWIKKNGLYNIRFSDKITPEMISVKYVLLHQKEAVTGDLWEVIAPAPEFRSAEDMVQSGYSTSTKKEGYFVYSIKKCNSDEFKNVFWDIRKLKGFKEYKPFTTSLDNLFKSVIVSSEEDKG